MNSITKLVQFSSGDWGSIFSDTGDHLLLWKICSVCGKWCKSISTAVVGIGHERAYGRSHFQARADDVQAAMPQVSLQN